MEAAVWVAVETEVDGQLSQDTMSEMVKKCNAPNGCVARCSVVNRCWIDESDELMSYILKMVAADVKQEAEEVKYVKRKEHKIELTLSSPLS